LKYAPLVNLFHEDNYFIITRVAAMWSCQAHFSRSRILQKNPIPKGKIERP